MVKGDRELYKLLEVLNYETATLILKEISTENLTRLEIDLIQLKNIYPRSYQYINKTLDDRLDLIKNHIKTTNFD